jgi:competence protein ComEA
MKHLFTALCVALCTLAAPSAWSAVEINRAGQAELESVKGIGPGMSAKILEARKKGEFKSWDDLVERVSGIGSGNANRLSQAGLTVAGSPYAAKNSATSKSFKGINHKTTDPHPAEAKSGKTARGQKSGMAQS